MGMTERSLTPSNENLRTETMHNFCVRACVFVRVFFNMKTWAGHIPGHEAEETPREWTPDSKFSYWRFGQWMTIGIRWEERERDGDACVFPLRVVFFPREDGSHMKLCSRGGTGGTRGRRGDGELWYGKF